MMLFIAHRVDAPNGEQFLITVLDDGSATIASRSTKDPAQPWTPPRLLGEVTTR